MGKLRKHSSHSY